MRISFDLDDPLICDRESTPQESDRVPFFLKPWINEPLRLGTCALIRRRLLSKQLHVGNKFDRASKKICKN